MEKIIEIKEVHDVVPNEKDSWNTCDGYFITTENQVIKLLIANGQSCCESWGYFVSDDNFSEFIGASIIDVKVVDNQLMSYDGLDLDNSELSVMFVNILTDKGVLQFVAHNSHNGYYGHTAYLISDQLTHIDNL